MNQNQSLALKILGTLSMLFGAYLLYSNYLSLNAIERLFTKTHVALAVTFLISGAVMLIIGLGKLKD